MWIYLLKKNLPNSLANEQAISMQVKCVCDDCICNVKYSRVLHCIMNRQEQPHFNLISQYENAHKLI